MHTLKKESHSQSASRKEPRRTAGWQGGPRRLNHLKLPRRNTTRGSGLLPESPTHNSFWRSLGTVGLPWGTDIFFTCSAWKKLNDNRITTPAEQKTAMTASPLTQCIGTYVHHPSHKTS